mgnify:CR=1 FL=1
MADVGQRRLVPDDPMSLVQARVPAGILPPTPQTGHALTRPDILVQEVGRADQGNEVRCVHVVEIKYAMDYNFAHVPAVAEGQHADLLTALSSVPSQRAELHVLPLGVAGGVPRLLADTLMRLGVLRTDLLRVQRDLHVSAIRHTHRVLAARRALSGCFMKRLRGDSARWHK